MMGPDKEMTKREIEKFSKKDAENYFKFDEQYHPFLSIIYFFFIVYLFFQTEQHLFILGVSL